MKPAKLHAEERPKAAPKHEAALSFETPAVAMHGGRLGMKAD
jgi:hypothetical protein